MPFQSKETREVGPVQKQANDIGPGSYLGLPNMLMAKNRISVKEPFDTQVNRNGKNTQSWSNLNEAQMLYGIKLGQHPLKPTQTQNDNQVEVTNAINQMLIDKAQQKLGPGYYKVIGGFDEIQDKTNQMKRQKSAGLDKNGVQLIKNSYFFKSQKDRFQIQKQIKPGPGYYEIDDNAKLKSNLKSSSSLRQLADLQQSRNAFSSSTLQVQHKFVHAPSIPSHMNVYGYNEDEKGNLVKQKSQIIGYSGQGYDRAGPGEYDPESARLFVQKTVKGVVPWKLPQEKPEKIKNILLEKNKNPGPGDYDFSVNPIQYRPTSSFKSKVKRSHTTLGLTRVKIIPGSINLNSNLIKDQNQKSQGNLYNVLKANIGEIQSTIDILEDGNQGKNIGPGAYYNPKTMTSFKFVQKPEDYQFFGSTVERFEKEIKEQESKANIGPGSYNLEQTKKSTSVFTVVPQAFSSSQQRFFEPSLSNQTPGPGEYKAPSLVQVLIQKIQSKKSGNFGFSEPDRFQDNKAQRIIPGPGQYDADMPSKNTSLMKNLQLKKQLNKQSMSRMETKKVSNKSSYIGNIERINSQRESFTNQRERVLRQVCDGYKNQIQYDNISRTIGEKVIRAKEEFIVQQIKSKRGFN